MTLDDEGRRILGELEERNKTVPREESPERERGLRDQDEIIERYQRHYQANIVPRMSPDDRARWEWENSHANPDPDNLEARYKRRAIINMSNAILTYRATQ